MMLAWCVASAVCAALPALLTLLNLAEYRRPVDAVAEALPAVAVIVPARNEAVGIAACVRSVLASRGVSLAVLVVDDASTDGTAAIVEVLSGEDARVRLLSATALPAGWNGKQHACWQGAQAVEAPLLLFLDADVRLQPDAVRLAAASLRRERAALLSGFPQQITGTWMESLLLPLIHFVLMGLLPMAGLRRSNSPAFAAGCGQFLLVDRAAYCKSGGHAAIRATMHDGLLLPKLLRRHGYATRLTDLTSLATCRMYTDAAGVWNGLAKNATEGLAAPARIVPVTLLLGLGQVLPVVLLWMAWQRTYFVIPFLGPPFRIGVGAVGWAAAAVGLSYLPRGINAVRFRQNLLSALLHPVGTLLLLLLEWWALVRKLLGRKAAWKAREYRVN